MPVTTLRKRNKWDGGRLQPRAQVIGGGAQQEGATIAMSKAKRRDVVSTLLVKDGAKKSVRGCSSPWVGLTLISEKEILSSQTSLFT